MSRGKEGKSHGEGRTGGPRAQKNAPAAAGSRLLGATPEALYSTAAVAAAAGAATAAGTGVILVRVSRDVLSLTGVRMDPITGLLAFLLLLVFAVSAGVLCGGTLNTLSRKVPRTSGPGRARTRAATAPPPVPAAPSPRASALLSAGPFASGSLLTAILGVAVGVVHAAPATWIAAALHATLAGTLCGSGAYLGAWKLFRKTPGPGAAPSSSAGIEKGAPPAPEKKATEGGGGEDKALKHGEPEAAEVRPR